jgi:hypothetical protein
MTAPVGTTASLPNGKRHANAEMTGDSLIQIMTPTDFWLQPAHGFTDETCGRTEAELQVQETRLGIRLPETYRALMKLQNGGYLRKRAYPFGENGVMKELFYNGATLEPLEQAHTFRDYLLNFLSDEEIADEIDLKTHHPDRLIVISRMDGHSCMCLDYGWQQPQPLDTPGLVFFDFETSEGVFADYLTIHSFDRLVADLVYHGYESETYFVGINTVLPLHTVAKQLGERLGVNLSRKTDDHYGWFNFDAWYAGSLDLPRHPVPPHRVNFQLTLSPNRHRAGTYLFQNHPDQAYIVEITPLVAHFTMPDQPYLLQLPGRGFDTITDQVPRIIATINALCATLNADGQLKAILLLAPFDNHS